jgi:hypothetical protein
MKTTALNARAVSYSLVLKRLRDFVPAATSITYYYLESNKAHRKKT